MIMKHILCAVLFLCVFGFSGLTAFAQEHPAEIAGYQAAFASANAKINIVLNAIKDADSGDQAGAAIVLFENIIKRLETKTAELKRKYAKFDTKNTPELADLEDQFTTLTNEFATEIGTAAGKFRDDEAFKYSLREYKEIEKEK